MNQRGNPHAPAPNVMALRELAPATLSMLEALVVQSQWNQVARDWAVFHSLGTIVAARDAQGHIVASGAVLPMGAVAWISMILVTPASRGQGLGRLVFEHCLRHVQRDGRVAMLDATPQGEPLYRQFGFEALWRLTRWRRDARAATGPALPTRRPSVAQLAAGDMQALGFNRHALLQDLLERPDSRCVQRESAFAIVRGGRVAQQIGPLVAAAEDAAVGLLNQAATGVDGPLLIDVPDDKLVLRQALLDAGFQPQRGFARMALAARGQTVPPCNGRLLHAIAGPEFA